MPQIGKIIKGQHLSLGVPSLSSPSLNQIAFWSHGGKRVKVLAQCVRFKECRGNYSAASKVISVGPKLAIPDDYEGWFEILSEEGRAVKCMESVGELAKRFPESCLVRAVIKAYLANETDVSDKVRVLQAGETLRLLSSDLTSPNRKFELLCLLQF